MSFFCNLGPRLVIAQFILVSPHHHHRFVSLNPIVSRVITKKLKLLFFSRSPKRLNCQLDSRRALSSKSKWNVNKQLPSFAQFILASFTYLVYTFVLPLKDSEVSKWNLMSPSRAQALNFLLSVSSSSSASSCFLDQHLTLPRPH